MTSLALDSFLSTPAFHDPESGLSIDFSGMDLTRDAVCEVRKIEDMTALLETAHGEMQRIEAGEIKNPDENRKVTHFSDRLSYPVGPVFAAVQEFAEQIRQDTEIDAVVINGIGGSALGPQLMQFAINGPYWNELDPRTRDGYPRIYFVDNTDPAGVADVLAAVDLNQTVVVSISKSGGTQETKNNMVAFEQAYAMAGLKFADFAIAVTMEGSKLHNYATEHSWHRIFPMAESIGGRTSETNVVGHVPAALTGVDFSQFLNGAQAMDEMTRASSLAENPADQLAFAWYIAGKGRGDRNMVVVPYSDRLALLGKYLQQLVMESLGKELDLDGNVVHQGLTVYGNKGGTDAHAYIQQLNDGRDDFFVTFIEPLEEAMDIPIEGGLSMGDYLHAFKSGLIQALRDNNRKVIDMTLDRVDEFNLGMIIALHERAVAFYAELIHINAFHQPGVQAYKLASKGVNEIQTTLFSWLNDLDANFEGTATDVAATCGLPGQEKAVDAVLNRLAVNERSFGGRTVAHLSRTIPRRYSVK
jgi:glucose-6-phosphate isomerase